MSVAQDAGTLALIASQTEKLYQEARQANFKRTDRMFATLMVAQWVFSILVALVLSPYAWEGKESTVHSHVWTALLLGGLITALPVFLALNNPGEARTRYVVGVSQMLWSGLLIHLTGGRIETHFHVFGSLAFIAFYRDWKTLLPATIIVAGDHIVRQFLWPESMFGLANPEWWRFIEHALWVVFIDFFLLISCLSGERDMRAMAARQAEADVSKDAEKQKSEALDAALFELRDSQDLVLRTEKLAAVGQLAASVGHELRNPLAAIRNAHTYISRKLASANASGTDPRIAQFLEVMDRELSASSKIISDLLDFARERPPSLQPCPLRPLVTEAISVVPPRMGVTIHNEIPENFPIPALDREQFRQVLVNLVQNASEAMPDGRNGDVHVRATGGDGEPFRVVIADNGTGIPADAREKIFQPLFTTKTKGTGLGLAIVFNVIKRHQGAISVESEVGKGTEFIIELPSTGSSSARIEAA